jgi:hypothetical protein
MGYNCLFTDKGVTVFRRSNGSFTFKDVLRGKLYFWILFSGKWNLIDA